MAGEKIKVGVVGVGRMGEHHLRKYLGLEDVEVVGIHDAASARLDELRGKYGVRVREELSDLLFEADAITIATPTATHFPVARQAIEAGVHVLIEKPITDRTETAEELVELARRRGVVLQVGLIERFRYMALARGINLTPVRYIETHRLSPTLSRENDIDVVTDLMIHDLDLVLSLMGQDPVQVSAIGVPVLTRQFDLANVRLEFADGAVVNLNVSRVSAEPVRKFRVFSLDAYASLDFIKNSVKTFYKKADTGQIASRHAENIQLDALEDQCRHFVDCVRNGGVPAVTGEDGIRALRYAKIIKERIRERAAWEPADVRPVPVPPEAGEAAD